MRRFLRKVGEIAPFCEYIEGRGGHDHLASRADMEVVDESQLARPTGRTPRIDLSTELPPAEIGPAIVEDITDGMARIPQILANRHLKRTVNYIPPKGAIPERLGR